MGMYKILLEDSIGYDFTLIAIHGSLEPYYLAYLLNKNLDVRLARTREDLLLTQYESTARYPCFEFNDKQQYIDYYVFSNKSKVTVNSKISTGLFEEQQSLKTAYFIPELQQVDYFIKVIEDGNAFAKAKTLKTLNQIPQIVTAYDVDVNVLKNKEHLIFE